MSTETLSEVLAELKRVALPYEKTHSSEYWNDVEVRCANATDVICDYDQFIKNLIELIENADAN